jgi:hypothetical protein
MAIFTITPTDSAVRIFDNFYSTRLRVNATDWDVVYSFFLGNSNDKTEASTFASLLFRIAQEGNYNVLDLLATIKGKTNNLGSYDSPESARDVYEKAVALLNQGRDIEHLIKRRN